MKKAALASLTLGSVLVVALIALGGTAVAGGTGTQQDPFGPGDKVTFCHYDGSETGGGSGKYNSPNASTTATGPAGHIGHSFDVIPSYWFQQNANSAATFYGGVNWPTLTNLPSSPVDFTPLLGSSASAFIAGGCGEPVTTTTVTTTSPPCEEYCTTTTTPPTTTTTSPPCEECSTTTTEPPTTTTQPPTTTTSPPRTTTTSPPTTTSVTTTTTTGSPTIAPPTSITKPPNHPHQPHRLAFTGSRFAVPLGALAGVLLLLGVLMYLRGSSVKDE